MGYLPCLKAVANREKQEAHSIETATNEEGHGDQNKVSKKEHNVESESVDRGGNNEEKTEAHLQKPQDQHVQKENSSEILASTSLMVATIIATVAFQAACQVPGGYDESGEPNLIEHNSLKRFMKLNSVSYGLSAFLMCFQFIVAILPRYFHIPYPRLYIFLLSVLSLLCMIGAFLSALNTQNSKPSDSAATGTYVALFLPSFPFMFIFYAHYILKHVSKYRFPFSSCSYFSKNPSPHNKVPQLKEHPSLSVVYFIYPLITMSPFLSFISLATAPV